MPGERFYLILTIKRLYVDLSRSACIENDLKIFDLAIRQSYHKTYHSFNNCVYIRLILQESYRYKAITQIIRIDNQIAFNFLPEQVQKSNLVRCTRKTGHMNNDCVFVSTIHRRAPIIVYRMVQRSWVMFAARKHLKTLVLGCLDTTRCNGIR